MTGAGKSSIMMAFVQNCLSELREKISIIPQEALLFNGTIRSNLDPFNVYDDARLNDALKRAWLIDAPSDASPSKSRRRSTEKLPTDEDGIEAETPTAAASKNKFHLDFVVEDEGLNLSVGERSLVSLARALVKNSQIIVLDEATAAVDYATDFRIQTTIRTEFSHATLLCIAHRLRTILSYDRILVMDKGEVAEFDSPENLFRKEDGIFRQVTHCF
ncbi:P-loop containing nucleoside triphosphate hydrolase protein [Atractiella rhizophila]|nr:P-loop containing nucleoside triphosphate hydrolase protein [Atractiella rhizophila]